LTSGFLPACSLATVASLSISASMPLKISLAGSPRLLGYRREICAQKCLSFMHLTHFNYCTR
jgi:hypothetical protein